MTERILGPGKKRRRTTRASLLLLMALMGVAVWRTDRRRRALPQRRSPAPAWSTIRSTPTARQTNSDA